MRPENTPRPDALRAQGPRYRKVLSFRRALAIALSLEAAFLLYTSVKWADLFPPKPPEPMKVEFVKLPEPPPPPPKPEPPPPDLPPPDKRAKPVKKPPAVYPKDALSQGIEGKVRVRLLVSGTGKVLETTVIESEPPGIFDYSALKAAKSYLFPPDDNGVEQFTIDQVFVYRIEDDRYGPQAGTAPKAKEKE